MAAEKTGGPSRNSGDAIVQAGQGASEQTDEVNPEGSKIGFDGRNQALGTPVVPGTRDTAGLFNLEDLRISQDFVEQAGIRTIITTVPVGKPHRQAFVRVHPGEDYRLQVALLVLKGEGSTYLVLPKLAAELPEEVDFFTLYTGITRQGNPFLWPVRLPGADGRHPSWDRSASDAAERAMHHWIRMQWKKEIMAFEIQEATGDLPDPVWPEESFPQLIDVAFRERVIGSYEHPVLRRLRGEC